MQSLRVTLLKTPVVGMVSMRSMSIASRQLPFLRPVNLQQPTRSMSILGGISDFASKKMENSKEAQFAKLIETMVNNDKWTFRLWKDIIDTQLSSWLMYIPGMSGREEMKEVKEFKTMLDAMTPEELDNPDKVNGQSKSRIALQSGKSIDDVNMMVFMLKQSTVMQQWLRLKKAANEKLPKSEHELHRMMAEDARVRGISTKIFNPKAKGGRSRSVL